MDSHGGGGMAEALSMAIGFVLGALTVCLVGLQAFKLAARYQRTGHASIESPVESATPFHGVPVNTEVSAHRRILQEAKENGADELQAMATAQGQRLSREDALAQAEQMLRGESPMGGVN